METLTREVDFLVVGGGTAGCMAAIKAKQRNPESKVLAYTRWNDEGSRVVVVINFSGDFLGGYAIEHFPHDGTWHEWTKDYQVEAQAGKLAIDLGGHEAQVFIS